MENQRNTAINNESWAGLDSAVFDGYVPSVGDKFHKPAGTYRDLFSGAIKDTPERNAEITMMSHNHVVAMIDGLKHAMTRMEFIKLAKKTLKEGSTLIRRT